MDIKKNIKYMLDKINSEEELLKIAKMCEKAIPITLDEYIDQELGCAPQAVKNKFKCEAIDFFCELKNKKIEIEGNGDCWCDMYIKGSGELDIWIGESYPIFHPVRLADCVFKMWKKEIIIE